MFFALKKSKISYYALVVFFLITAYFFLKFAEQERHFLNYPRQPVASELKTEAIELKGGIFFITKKELDVHDADKKHAYIFFILTTILAGINLKIKGFEGKSEN